MITNDILTLIGIVDTTSTADMLAFRDIATLELTKLYGMIVIGGDAAKPVYQPYYDLLSQCISVENLLNRRNLT